MSFGCVWLCGCACSWVYLLVGYWLGWLGLCCLGYSLLFCLFDCLVVRVWFLLVVFVFCVVAGLWRVCWVGCVILLWLWFVFVLVGKALSVYLVVIWCWCWYCNLVLVLVVLLCGLVCWVWRTRDGVIYFLACCFVDVYGGCGARVGVVGDVVLGSVLGGLLAFWAWIS